MTGFLNGKTFGATLVAALVFLVTAGVAIGAVPAVVTNPASAISNTSARLNGSVDPNGEATTWYFEFGTTTSYGTKTANTGGGAGNNPTNHSVTISGLATATTYHYRIVATNASGTTLGADRTFTTQGPPAVVTGAAQDIGPRSVVLNGTVDPRGRATSWHFEYGTTTSYGTNTPSRNAGSGNGAATISEPVPNLTPGVTYHYRLVASNGAGSTSGADGTFATPPGLTLKASTFRVIAGRFVSLSGVLTGAPAGVTVTISGQTFGSAAFAQLATVATGGGGVWTYLAQPKIGTTYQASANGNTTAPLTVGVQPAISLQLITKARFSTRVTAATTFTGKLVKLQRLAAGGTWVTVKQTRLNANSGAIFSASLLPRGRSTIRVAMSVNQSGPGYLGGFSRQLTYTRH
jgi:hypothetical protein